VPFSRRVAYGLAATALIAAPILGVVSSATAAPASPHILNPATGYSTSSTTVDLSGSADSGSTVTVFAGGVAIPGCTDLPVVEEEGGPVWVCELAPLDYGTTSFRAQATVDGVKSGKSSRVDVTRFGTDPASVNGPASTTNPYPTFYGTGAQLGTVSVYVGEGTGCTADVDTDGNWECKSHVPLSYGTNNLFAYGTTFDGVDDEVGYSFSVDVQLGVPTVKYSFSPAKIAFKITGVAGANVYTEFYEAVAGEGIDYLPAGECPETSEDAANPLNCSFSSLDPGVYNAYSSQDYYDEETDGYFESGYLDDYILIPSTPTLNAPATAEGVTHFSGTGEPGFRVIVRTGSGDTACKDIVNGSGNWSCSAHLGGGTHAVRATQESRGFNADEYFSGEGGSGLEGARSFNGLSAYTAAREFSVPFPLVIASAPTPTPSESPTPTETPTPTPTPPAFVWDFSISGDGDGTYTGGEKITISGDGPPGSGVAAELHSTPIPLGSTTVGPSGTFSMNVVIPSGVDPGSHAIVVTITPPGDSPATAEAPVTIADPNAAPATDDTAAPRDKPNSPALFTTSVKTVTDAFSSPITLGAAAGAGMLLLLFVALPAELLNSTLEEHYERMFGRVPFLKRRTGPRFPRLVALLERYKIIGGIALTLLAALIFGFADPGFGFDLASMRTVLASAIALFIVGYLASALTGRILRGRWEMVTTIELKPLGIVLTIFGVLLSRLLDFSPGFLFGLVIGLGMIGASTLAERVKLTLVNSALIFGFAILAWLGYSAIAGNTTGFWDTLGNDTLVAVTSEGLTALVVGLLPFRFLDGESLFLKSKPLWAVAYLISAASFVLILVPAADNWGEAPGPVWLWLGVLVLFSIIAFGLYLYFRLTHEDEEHESEHESEHAQV
jgi:hypothetical protein